MSIKKLNVLANKLATKAVAEAKIEEPKWSAKSAPILRIIGKTITKNEGTMISIAGEGKRIS